jgi:hypothetical protein
MGSFVQEWRINIYRGALIVCTPGTNRVKYIDVVFRFIPYNYYLILDIQYMHAATPRLYFPNIDLKWSVLVIDQHWTQARITSALPWQHDNSKIFNFYYTFVQHGKNS